MAMDLGGERAPHTRTNRVPLIALGLLLATGLGCDEMVVARATVNVKLEPAGGGTVIVDGGSCSADCTRSIEWTYDPGDGGSNESKLVSYSATAATGFGFDGWTAGGCPTNSCEVRVDKGSTLNVTARFRATTPPTITTQPSNLTVAEAGSTRFQVVASGPALKYQWFRANGPSFTALPNATESGYTVANAQLTDDGAQFRVDVMNDAGTVTSDPARLTVIAGACPVPPRDIPFDQSAPPNTPVAAAELDKNLLVDGGFEQSVRVGLAPAGFGYWRFDEAVSVSAQQGITPRGGPNMLHFVGTGRPGGVTGSASEQLQLIDVSALSAAIDNNELEVTASAYVNRITGCALTDDSFGVVIIAFDGLPTTFATRLTAGVNQALDQGVSRDVAVVTGAWLQGGHKTATITHGQPGTWLPISARMNVPAGTRFLAINVYVNENKANDPAFPELHGHYADDASVVVTRRQP